MDLVVGQFLLTLLAATVGWTLPLIPSAWARDTIRQGRPLALPMRFKVNRTNTHVELAGGPWAFGEVVASSHSPGAGRARRGRRDAFLDCLHKRIREIRGIIVFLAFG